MTDKYLEKEGNRVHEAIVDNNYITSRVYENGKHTTSQHGIFRKEFKHSDDNMVVAFLGDLHGHIDLASKILETWSKETGRTLDYVFQVGDMGAYEDYSKIDKTTLDFFKKDDSELDFIKYFTIEKKPETWLYKKCPSIIFIKGNHDDADFLDSRKENKQGLVDLDSFGKFKYLPNGNTYVAKKNGFSLRVGGFGGVKNTHSNYDRKDIDKICSNSNIDILLTHDSPILEDQRYGDETINYVLDQTNPILHFCGHHHEKGKFLSNNISYSLNEINSRSNDLTENSIAIVEFSEDDFFLEYVNHSWYDKLE